MNIITKYKESFKKDSQRNFIWLGNIEVEDHWEENDVLSIPGSHLKKPSEVIHHMGEMALFLAGENDTVCLKKEPDKYFLDYIMDLRGFIPEIFIGGEGSDKENITESLLKSKKDLDLLRENANQYTYLLPYGTSIFEEKLSNRTAIKLATPSSDIYKKVNSKVYSRMLASKRGIKQVDGMIVYYINELDEVFQQMKKHLTETPLVLKEAMGVSGKGIIILDSEKKCDSILRLLKKTAKKRNLSKTNLIIEKWIPKKCDINYQFVVDKEGGISGLTIKEALVNNGVHFGHISPPSLTNVQMEKIGEAAKKIGEEISKDGFFGIVGVDAMIDINDEVLPCVEINARLNMATYQSWIDEKCTVNNNYVLARPFYLTVDGVINFSYLETKLGDLLYIKGSKRGVIILSTATLNLPNQQNNTKRRLYTVIIGESKNDCFYMSQRIEQILSEEQKAVVEVKE